MSSSKKYEYFRKKIKVPQVDGSFKRKEIYAHSQKELDNKIKQALLDANREIEKALNPTFNMIADEWNEVHEKEVSYYTHNGYQAPLQDLKDRFGNELIKEITPFELQQLINTLGNQGYAKHTIALRKIVASLVFDYAIINGYIKYNPATSIKIPKNAPSNKRELPSDEDIEKVKQSLDKPFGLFAYFILYTGCRRGEALALKYEDIDFRNNTIDINKVVVFENGKAKICNRAKSKSGVRQIPLLVPLKNILNSNSKGYIFNYSGELLTLSQFNIRWKNYVKTANVKLTPHQLRHAFATICFDAGLSPKDASQILGHSKIE